MFANRTKFPAGVGPVIESGRMARQAYSSDWRPSLPLPWRRPARRGRSSSAIGIRSPAEPGWNVIGRSSSATQRRPRYPYEAGRRADHLGLVAGLCGRGVEREVSKWTRDLVVPLRAALVQQREPRRGTQLARLRSGPAGVARGPSASACPGAPRIGGVEASRDQPFRTASSKNI
jgi:hypothetical protein